jgi:hypothetical protein
MKLKREIVIIKGVILYVLLITFFVWIYIILYLRDTVNYKVPTEISISSGEHLQTYGFSIHQEMFSNTEIKNMQNDCVKKNYRPVKEFLLNSSVLQSLINHLFEGKEYVFQDYIWIIEKSAAHTCHRDNNGDFFNEGQQYPSYTMIIYLENMKKCLNVIPESHTSENAFYTNYNNSMKNLSCNQGDIIIFNANLIHCGFVTKENNLRIQLKITHKNDIPHIQYYQNFNKVLNQENNYPIYLRKIQQNVSCLVPGLANLTQRENIRTSRGTQDGVNIGVFQKLFSWFFYGDRNYFDLPNAF